MRKNQTYTIEYNCEWAQTFPSNLLAPQKYKFFYYYNHNKIFFFAECELESVLLHLEVMTNWVLSSY